MTAKDFAKNLVNQIKNKKMEKQKVYYIKTEDSTPSKIVLHDIEAVLEWIRNDLDGATEGDSYEYEVGCVHMTEEELSNLQEADL